MVLQCDQSLTLIGEETVTSEQPLWGSLTLHHFGLIVSAIFGSIAIVIALTLMSQHALHYSRPSEQKHIIRILFMIPIYATISFVSYVFYRHSIYWEVLRDCYEAFAIASFFTLLCNYVEPTLHDQKNYFRKLEAKNWVWPLPWVQKCSGGPERGLLRRPRSGLTWFNIIWIGIFQYCAIRVIFTFVAMITQLLGRYCDSSLNPGFGHVWVLGFDAVSVTIAMYCLIQFYVQLRNDLVEHKPFLKVCCIKLVIFFSFWQNSLISFLSSSVAGHGPIIKTSAKLSYIDIKVGIPCVLLTVEMAVFAVIHIFAFPWKPYDIRKSADPSAHYKGGAMGIYALLDAFNPWDIIKAVARGFRWLFCGVSKRKNDRSYDAHNGVKHLSSSTFGRAAGAMDMPVPGSFHGQSVEEGTELGPPKRRDTQPEDYEDHTSLLARPQRIPKISIHPYDRQPLYSGQSSPGVTHSPGLPPRYLDTASIETPPSPLDDQGPPSPSRMEQGVIHQSQQFPGQRQDTGYHRAPYPDSFGPSPPHQRQADMSYHATTTGPGARPPRANDTPENFPLPSRGQLPEYRGGNPPAWPPNQPYPDRI